MFRTTVEVVCKIIDYDGIYFVSGRSVSLKETLHDSIAEAMESAKDKARSKSWEGIENQFITTHLEVSEVLKKGGQK